MSIWMAIILGLVQGLTEFLPVSSSGHLVLLQKLFNMPENMLLFDIILHLATLCAVIIVFRKKIWELICKPFCKTNYCLLVATLITCSMVLLFKDIVDNLFTYRILPVTFLITAIILFVTSFINKGQKSIEYGTSFAAGIAQSIAVIPGFSRSGFTIASCIFTGTKRADSAEFSFLMSIPIIIASFVYELSSGTSQIVLEVVPTIFAFIAALLAGILAIKFMLKVVKSIKLYWFSAYLITLSIVLLFVF